MSHFRRWGLIWAVIVMAILMVGSALWTQVGFWSHADELAEIHGEYMMSLDTFDGRELPELLEGNRHSGVLAISRFDGRGDMIESVGWSPSPELRAPDGPVRVEHGHYRVEIVRDDGNIVVEYAPLLAFDLARRTLVGVALSVVAASLLIVVAILWTRYRLQLEAADREASKTRHLAQLGTLSAVVAHELRNPLTVLLGHVQLVREDLPDNRNIRHIEEGALRLDGLLESLLVFARTGDVAVQMVPLRSLIDRAGEDAGVVDLVVEGDVPEWRLDPERMHQVLVNLLKNAASASPGKPVLIGMRVDKTDLLLEVWDEGSGIPDDAMDKIFEPFFTTRTQGTGLGLAVARDIVVKHGGTLTACNPTGGGAQFTARIPA